jgi:regulatory protein
MTGRRRGRTGRGWDAAPPRARRAAPGGRPGPAATDPGASPDPAGRPPGPAGDPAYPAGDPAELAREICLRQLAVRPRTRSELATTLRRRGVDDRVAAEVLDRYDQVGMIDDAAFARAWVTSRHHSRGLARRALGDELRQRGVAPEAVGEALGQLDPDTEDRTARALVERRLRTATGAPEAIARRLVGMLARKGYPAGLAYRVVKDALAEDERTAALADQLDPEALADGDDSASAADPTAGPAGPGEATGRPGGR